MRPLTPWACAAFASFTASSVESADMAATTGTLLATAPTSVSRSAIFSSKESVAASPSEPTATIPLTPFSICQRAWRATKAWSMFRFASNAVAHAGMTPFHFMLVLFILSCVIMRETRRQIRLARNGGAAVGNDVGNQCRGGQGGGDAQAFMPCGQQERGIGAVRPDERQLVGRGGTEAGPDTNGAEAGNAGQVFFGA